MAEKQEPYTVRCYVEDGDNKILWSEYNFKTKETKIFLSPEEAEYYENKIMDNIGKGMSRYIQNHHESALWGKTM